ncbi:hypothetical protein [Pseudoalteromonas sp. Ps84H-4]|uniref:hypothetical protein n=1 Tax=Pseudoalteromonas sp. Ps84H-4 TaxID=2954502 RepID=UPI0020973278|nr:hypothetical protein [Pseudoalteromonas sp. Ps84H-4]MCO7251664.1 hypothetical protein [Pseudoalteromonas sp. Ps84H-4]
MSNKKLPASLQKVLDTHKTAWQVDENELAKRINNARISYLKSYPTLGDKDSNALVILPFRNFSDVVKALTTELKECDIDYQRTTVVAGGTYRIAYTKPLSVQDADLERIEKQVKQKYQSELEAIKQEYVENLLFEHEQKQIEAKQVQEKEHRAKLKETLLSLLD